MENQFQALDSRIGQIEEYNRSRGQSEILKMENLEDLRDELARMRGEIEVLQHEFDQVSLQEMGRAADTDYRLLWLENRAESIENALGMKASPPPDLNSAPGESMAAPAEEGSESGEAAETVDPVEATPGEAQGESGSETEAGDSSEASNVESSETNSSTETGSASESGEPGSAVAEPAQIDPAALIRLAESHLAGGKEEEARAALDRFLELYPDHEGVPQALYRKAESYFNEGEYSQSANVFKVVVERYRESKWAPYAMLRQGECFEALERPDDAEAFYRALIQLWPNGRAAAEAKQKIKDLE
jgi:tol-pal system protein YbgF